MASATLVPESRVRVGGPGSRDRWRTSAPRLLRTGAAAVLLPAALMLLLGFVGLDRHSVWRDEAASLVAARRSLPDLWAMLGHTETVHALYYTVLHAWLQLGGGEAWARVPSVLAMAVTAGLVGAVGVRLASPAVGLVAGLLVVANPSASFYAQEARSTALVGAVALLATWVLLRAVAGRRGWWAVYLVAGVVLVGLNALAILVLVAHGVTLLWWRSPRRALARWALATVPALALTVALGVAVARQPYQIGWIPRPGPSSVRDFAHLVLGPTRPLLAVLTVLVLVGVLTARSASGRRLAALAVPLAALPVVVLLATSFVQPVFVPRYVFPSVAGIALLAAVGIAHLARAAGRRLGGPRSASVVAVVVAGAAVLTVAVLGVGAQRQVRTPASRPDDLAAAAAVVATQARPGDAVLFLPDNRRLVALAYPGPFTGLHDLGLAQDPIAAENLTGRTLPVPEVLAGLDASGRVWAIGRPGLELMGSETGSRTELDRLRRDFVPVETADVDGVGVTLFARRPAS